MILSSETLNMESTASNTQENVLQAPDFSPDIDIISDEYSEFGIENEIINENSEEISKSDISDEEYEIQKQEPKTETQLPQPNIIEIIYQDTESSGEKFRDELVCNFILKL